MIKKLGLSLLLMACLLLGGHSIYASPDNTSNEEVSKFVFEAATEIMSFGFENYDERKLQNKKYFTDDGYKSFYKAMNASRIPETIATNKRVIFPRIKCDPFVRKFDNEKWTAIFPLALSYVSGQKLLRQQLIVELYIAKTLNGFGIVQWIAVGRDIEDIPECIAKPY